MTATESIIEYGLNANAVAVLFFLARKGDAKAIDVAKGTDLQPAALTRIFDRLEKLKLVKRKNDKNDRRAVIVSLTKSGNELSMKL